MGVLSWKALGEPTMIRIAIVVCCAALAATEGEADRYSYSSNYNYNYDTDSNGQQGLFQPGSSTYSFPNLLGSIAALLTPNSYSGQYDYPGFQAGFAAPATVGAHQPFGYAGTRNDRISKREAEAKPKAEADAFYNSFYSPAYNMAYTNGFPAMRSYAAPFSSYPGYSRGSFYSGYRNFCQPSNFGGYGHF